MFLVQAAPGPDLASERRSLQSIASALAWSCLSPTSSHHMPFKAEPVPTHSILSPCFLTTGLCSVSPDPSPHHSSLHLSPPLNLIQDPGGFSHFVPYLSLSTALTQTTLMHSLLIGWSYIIPELFQTNYCICFAFKKEAMLHVYLNYLLHVTEVKQKFASKYSEWT